MARRGLFLLSLIAWLSALGWGAIRLALFSWNSVVGYQSPYLGPELPPSPASPPLTDRVVLVVIDGLRRDAAAAAMPTLNRLAARGARFTVHVGQPSLSYPGWTVIGSGTWPRFSGVVTNGFHGPVRVDSIFREAQRAGARPVGAGTGGWLELFGPWFDRFEVPDVSVSAPEDVDRLDAAILERGLMLLRDPSARLVLLYFTGPDEYGHAFGGASTAYRESVRRTDGWLARVVSTLDLSRTTLVVTTDHGHIDAGGHGGWEPIVTEVPLVMVGKGIRAGVEGRGDQVDIAPTLAALLGVPIPVHAMGRPLGEALEGSSEALDAIARASAQQRARWVHQIEQILGRTPTRFPAVKTAADLPAFDQEVSRAMDRAYEERLRRDRLGRAPVVGLGLALIALWAALLFRPPDRGTVLGGVLVFTGIVWGLYFGRGYRWSLSVLNTEAQIQVFFMGRALDAWLGWVGVALLVGIRKGRRWGEAFEGILRAYGGIALAFGFQALLFYGAYGISYPWGLPDLGWGFKDELDLLTLGVLWPDLPGMPEPLGIPTALLLPALGATLGVTLRAALRRLRQA